MVFTNINNSHSTQASIYERLNTPVGPSNLERLLFSSTEVPPEQLEGIEVRHYESVLDINLYVSIEEELRNTVYEE